MFSKTQKRKNAKDLFMKKIMVLLVAVLTATLFTACSTTNTSDAGTMNLYPDLYKPAKAYRPKYNVDLTNKITGTANVHVLFGIFVWGESKFADNASIFADDSAFSWLYSIFPSAKNISAKAAFYKACAAYKQPKTQKPADAIIAARYEVVTKDYFVYQNLNTKVTGYPAVMEGLDEVKVISFYIDGKGNMHVLSGNDVYVNIAPVVKVGWF